MSDGKATRPPTLPPPPCGCDQDPIAGLARMFVTYAQGRALAAGRSPASRPVFLRLHGVAAGRLEIRPDLPAALAVGLFQPGARYDAWIRFSSDVQPGRPELKGTCGVGVKLFGVPGAKLLEPDTAATTHDLIFQNHPVFFVDDAAAMCAFTCASLNGQGDAWLAAHPTTARILAEMEHVVPSVLRAPYSSTLPYRFGDGYCKYALTPHGDDEPVPPGFDPTDPTYLRADLHRRLAAREARFTLSIQLRTDDDAMPLDRATVPWSETASKPIPVATLIIPAQDLDARGQSDYGERLAFNPWHALPVHAPVGTLADARRVVYRASADQRRDVEGQPRGEPTAPRPPQWGDQPYPAAVDQQIVRAAIHPAIGIARVGGSQDAYYLGPEVVEPPAPGPGDRRDATGAIKRQAAQFRIYGYNAAGAVVRELTADWADIQWRVHVANHKASWFQWRMALDVPEAAALVVPRRNPTVAGPARAALDIDPGAHTIAGRATSGPDHVLTGTFQGTPVTLGELRTDPSGRLIFLGGRGVSASPTQQPIFDPTDDDSFINANGWYDDTADGPVDATVIIDGAAIPVEGAWVVTAPPDYAPNVFGVRTLYDLLVDVYITAGWLPFPTRVSFQRDIWPILRRLSGLQWVNQGFAAGFGAGSLLPFDDPDFVRRLAQPPPKVGFDRDRELRRQIHNSFRGPAVLDGNQLPWPWVYGDAMESPAIDNPRQNATISATQERLLAAWAAGDFDGDFDPGARGPSTLAEVPLADQPATLDRAALEHALADAFHPGCEVTWPIRHQTMYTSPFRVRRRPAGDPGPSYGKTLTQPQVLGLDGPLYSQGPGDLSRWMGLPWQADTAFCRSGYDPSYDPYVPTFWPARVPNQVITLAQYRVLIDPSYAPTARLDAFADRSDWNAPLRGSTAAQMLQMVAMFDQMGLLEVRPGPTDLPGIPAELRVAARGTEAAVVVPVVRLGVGAAAITDGAAPATAAEAAATAAAHDAGAHDAQAEHAVPVHRPLPVRKPRP